MHIIRFPPANKKANVLVVWRKVGYIYLGGDLSKVGYTTIVYLGGDLRAGQPTVGIRQQVSEHIVYHLPRGALGRLDTCRHQVCVSVRLGRESSAGASCLKAVAHGREPAGGAVAAVQLQAQRRRSGPAPA